MTHRYRRSPQPSAASNIGAHFRLQSDKNSQWTYPSTGPILLHGPDHTRRPRIGFVPKFADKHRTNLPPGTDNPRRCLIAPRHRSEQQSRRPHRDRSAAPITPLRPAHPAGAPAMSRVRHAPGPDRGCRSRCGSYRCDCAQSIAGVSARPTSTTAACRRPAASTWSAISARVPRRICWRGWLAR